ncbi:PREDICTED: 3-mercaptopyruvate sulfurtransferase [Colobus angolensis palliatus]|nr:PREDICTED: 3-mercaptopyruvate sulfurtransferase [Colobus angolensis palliatus]
MAESGSQESEILVTASAWRLAFLEAEGVALWGCAARGSRAGPGRKRGRSLGQKSRRYVGTKGDCPLGAACRVGSWRVTGGEPWVEGSSGRNLQQLPAQRPLAEILIFPPRAWQRQEGSVSGTGPDCVGEKLGRDARREFEERHIPGAAFFDIDQCSDRTSPYDHMLPSAQHFADYAGRLGVGAATHVVIYDASDQGLYSAPRVWWMFRAFGHRAVSLLDGGLRHWLRQNFPLSSGKTHPAPAEFRAQLDPAFIKTYEEIRENLESRRFQVVDARAAGRFRGIEPEPRDGIEPGHIPGTVNIPFTDFLTQEGLEKSPEEIRHLFQEKKVDLSKPLVATCGSGVTACHVALGAYLCGKPDVPIYDGSWVEWYMRARPEDVISEGRGKTH